MHVRAPAGAPALPVHHQARTFHRDAHELALRRGRAAPGAGAHRLVAVAGGAQEDTSESQMIARWRSRASSPMS